MKTMSQFKNHYDLTLQLYRDGQTAVLDFGHSALVDIQQGKTIRQMSIDLCGNNGLEDKVGRYIMAAEWDTLIASGNGQLYEDVRTWLSPSHFAVLFQLSNKYDYEYAHDLMEQCLIRNSTEISEARPVEWLRAKLQDPGAKSTAQIWHKVWTLASKALPEAWSVLERKGNEATRKDKRRIRILSMVVKEFSAEAE